MPLIKHLRKLKIELKTYTGIKVGKYSPPFKKKFSDEDNRKMIQIINDFTPDVLFIGMTCPKQELWAWDNHKEINARVLCSIGAVFDFYAENINFINCYSKANILSVEMEASALFTIANLKRLRAGAILAVDSNLVTGIKKGEFEPGERTGELDQRVQRAIEDEIKIAIEAVKLLEVSHSFT